VRRDARWAGVRAGRAGGPGISRSGSSAFEAAGERGDGAERSGLLESVARSSRPSAPRPGRTRWGGCQAVRAAGGGAAAASAGDGPGARARGPGRRFEAGEGAGCAAHLRRVVPGEKGRPGARGADAGRGGVRRWGPTCGPLAGQFRGRLSRRVSGRRGGGRGWARPAGGGNLTSRGT